MTICVRVPGDPYSFLFLLLFQCVDTGLHIVSFIFSPCVPGCETPSEVEYYIHDMGCQEIPTAYQLPRRLAWEEYVCVCFPRVFKQFGLILPGDSLIGDPTYPWTPHRFLTICPSLCLLFSSTIPPSSKLRGRPGSIFSHSITAVTCLQNWDFEYWLQWRHSKKRMSVSQRSNNA